MLVPTRGPNASHNQTPPAPPAARPSNELARERIAALRARFATGALDADEVLAGRGPGSQLKLS